MDSEPDKCNRGLVLFFFIKATLQSAGCSEGPCCVSEITLAFNLTKSLCLKRGSSNWQAAPTDVDASHSVCCVFNREGSTACSVYIYLYVCVCVRVTRKGWPCMCSCGWYRLNVCLSVYAAAWWHLLYVLPAYPGRFVWQLYDLCVLVRVCAGWLSQHSLWHSVLHRVHQSSMDRQGEHLLWTVLPLLNLQWCSLKPGDIHWSRHEQHVVFYYFPLTNGPFMFLHQWMDSIGFPLIN